MGEWLSSNGMIVAAFLSVVATALAAVATYRAPMLAVRVAEALRRSGQRDDEQRRLRLAVFFTLMQERATIASPLSVQMLNAIDAVFHDCPDVREAWADLFHVFGNLKNFPAGVVEDKHRELLRQMAIHLGLSESLKRDDFSRTYYPEALAEEAYVRSLERVHNRRRLEGALPTQAAANTAPSFATTTNPPDNPYPPRPA